MEAVGCMRGFPIRTLSLLRLHHTGSVSANPHTQTSARKHHVLEHCFNLGRQIPAATCNNTSVLNSPQSRHVRLPHAACEARSPNLQPNNERPPMQGVAAGDCPKSGRRHLGVCPRRGEANRKFQVNGSRPGSRADGGEHARHRRAGRATKKVIRARPLRRPRTNYPSAWTLL